MTWLNKMIRRFCEWNIIMAQSTLTMLDMFEFISNMNKSFKDKIDPPHK